MKQIISEWNVYGNDKKLIVAFRMFILGGGRNVDDQNVDRPKISERQNGLLS